MQLTLDKLFVDALAKAFDIGSMYEEFTVAFVSQYSEKTVQRTCSDWQAYRATPC